MTGGVGCAAASKGKLFQLFSGNDSPSVEEQANADMFIVVNCSTVDLPNVTAPTAAPTYPACRVPQPTRAAPPHDARVGALAEPFTSQTPGAVPCNMLSRRGLRGCQMIAYKEKIAGNKPLITWCMELDTLRADLGLFGFPSKDVHFKFLCNFTPVFYLRQRAYSKSVPIAPFVVNYNGALFRTYPSGWQARPT